MRAVVHYSQSLNKSHEKSQEEKRKGLTILSKPPEPVKIETKVIEGNK